MVKVERCDIPAVVVITPERHSDARGYLCEVFRQELLTDIVGDVQFVQHNQAYSVAKGTVRGLHFQVPPKAQGKLVRCLRGAIFDVAVDLRGASPSFGKHVAVELRADTGQQLWIPEGFAHGFCTLEPDTEVLYVLTSYYSPDHVQGLKWDDTDLDIRWPVSTSEVTLSEKDAQQPALSKLPRYF